MKKVFRSIWNLYVKHKTKNYTQIPLFIITFNYEKYKENGKSGSCDIYPHPMFKDDEEIKELINITIDHIRNTYDMEQMKELIKL